MLSNWVEARNTAQTTVISLTIGLAALAGLALWTSLGMQRAATHLHELNEMSDRWGLVVQNVDVADHALTDYVRSGTPVMRQPVANAAGDAEESLRWLRANGGPADVRAATIVGDLYGDYTTLLRETVAAGDRGDVTGASQKADQAELTLVSLRKQLSTVVQL
ncbi:hypothetical protein ACQKHW_04275 [Staphylococcus hominis]|uniref:hypothetical protein n=1 Tax=Staphylococcus hominis TaxID=1290 RepID=UPI003CFE2106